LGEELQHAEDQEDHPEADAQHGEAVGDQPAVQCGVDVLQPADGSLLPRTLRFDTVTADIVASRRRREGA
ncbi:MAG TPA: hypothetical protein VG474_02630, partial [Solirubrobacteraceae bacterium]|nr:hypothetical protein [Solirubrobacteraceae bacterium]